MHSLNHIHLAHASSAAREADHGAARAHERPHGPPGRGRELGAKALAALALRLDREAVRRAVA